MTALIRRLHPAAEQKRCDINGWMGKCLRWRRALVFGLFLAMLISLQATAEVRLLQESAAGLDQGMSDAILSVFRRADEAIKTRDVEGVMVLYSDQYNYHGLTKYDMRKLWYDLVEEFQDLSNVLHLSRLAQSGSGSQTIVEVTCTGSLSGLSQTGGLRVPIDSWYEEVHYLTLENGQWRIRGNVGDQPRLMPFGTAPHPLF